MSLINKVLRDLERQRADDDSRARHSLLVEAELRPVRPVRRGLPPRPQLIRLALVLALVAVAAFAWVQWGGPLLKKWNAPAPVAKAPPPPGKTVATPALPAPKVEPVVPPPAKTETAKVDPPAVPQKELKATKPPGPPPLKPVPAAPPPLPSVADVIVRKPRDTDVAIAVPKDAKPRDRDVPVAVPSEAKPQPEAPEKTVTAKAAPEAGAPDAVPSGPEAEPVSKSEAVPRPVLEKKVKPLTPEQRAESEYRLAAAALQNKRSGEAESRLRVALTAQPTHLKARELLAGLLLQGGRWRDAQAQLEKGVDLHPLHYPFAQLLARVYVDHGQEKKALELLEKTRAAGSGDADYLAFLATLKQRAGRQDDAARNFRQALALRPQEGRWWLGLAISLEATGKWRESAEAYERAATSGSLDRKLQQYSQQRLAVVKNK